MAFNPIKEDKGGKSFEIKWTTAILDQALKGLEQGKKLVANPFYENKTYLLKGDLVFTHTKEELREWKKCKNDILYFASKYCKLMTPEGIKHITLRDYQIEYLRHLQDHRLSIFLACRQCGKCLSLTSVIHCKLTDEFLFNIDDRLYKRWMRLYYIKELDIFQLPLFELYNIYDDRFIWKFKYPLYKILYNLICLKVKKESQIE